MSLEERKRLEGVAHITAGEKYLETSVWKLKFTPDWDSAANEYNKAAIAFKVARDWAACKAAHLKACEGYANSGSLFHAGKQLDQCLLICKEMGDLTDVEDLASRGGLLYRQAGSPEAAAQMLVRAAKMLELSEPSRAISLYEKAAETVSVEDRASEAGAHLEVAAKLLVRVGEWERALTTLDTTLTTYQDAGIGVGSGQHGRLVIAAVLINIARGDCVAAGKVWSQWGGLCDSSQAGVVSTILQGFTEQDGELAKRGLESPVIRSLDNDYVKLARDLQVPQLGEDEELDLC